MKIMSKTRGMLTALAVPPLFALSAFAQYNDLPSVARIAYLSGNVSLQTAASPYWSVAPPNYPMVSGDRLYADQDGRAVIQNGLADVRVWGYSDVTLTNLTAQSSRSASRRAAFAFASSTSSPATRLRWTRRTAP